MVSQASHHLLALAGLVASVTAQAPSISPQNDIPSWAADSTMQLSLSSAGGDVLPLDYTIMPSTESLGLNQSEVARGSVKIEGVMIAATPDNYDTITGPMQIAYLSCDTPENGGSTTPDIMLLEMMENRPRAIVLYSTVGNWCMLEGSDLPYQSIFTMADAGDATQAYDILNNTNESDVIQVTITGNTTSEGRGGGGGSGGNDSAVAMSILYSITGLITLLFLVIIGTGAVRAHRYPERYGPRASHGGRPRQSRAKGLARAVLETLPIVKFGNPAPPKPDPNLELESASIDNRPRDRPVDGVDADSHEPTRLNDAPPQTPAAAAAAAAVTSSRPPGTETRTAGAPPAAESNPVASDEYLGCSICTEDFNVGEDVRVLPCDHKYHPTCIDPWLVNVSGTCPLCRLDLRPKKAGSNDEESAEDESDLPPPLELDGQDVDGASAQQRRRTSRFLDLNRLRHASVEERIQALRQFRSEQRAQDLNDPRAAENEADHEHGRDHDNEVDARSRRTKLTDKLRDKFRIRTRPQGSGDS